MGVNTEYINNIKLALENMQDIDDVLEWWWESFDKKGTSWETEEQFKRRRDVVMPLMIEEKQKRNEMA